jgi:Zn-dependent membrane protease YugP
MFLDPSYFMWILPPLLLGIWASSRVKSTFNKYSKVRSGRNVTGAQAARMLLDANGLQNVAVERVAGNLSDHYDPRSKTLRLSEAVFATPSISAVGVAAHEAGHALQDQAHYAPLKLRGAMVPAVQIGSNFGPILFIVGLLLSGTIGTTLSWVGILLFAAAAVFALVTLPVEFNASKRAKLELVSNGILTPEEVGGVDKVLDAAAWTYVAAAIQAIATLLYYVGFMGRSSRD